MNLCYLLEITASLLRAYKPLKWKYFSKILLRIDKFSGLQFGDLPHLHLASTTTPFESCIDFPTSSPFLGWLGQSTAPPHSSSCTSSSYRGPVICGILAGSCGHLIVFPDWWAGKWAVSWGREGVGHHFLQPQRKAEWSNWERVVHNRVKSNRQQTQSQGVTAQSQIAKSKGGHPESRASTSKLKHQGIHEKLNERVGQE